ncbi:MAG TPA: COX15/CtaA family protein, partial [Gemmataceae bacterium]|nr:COX15/CtaA family protein [Gemmataceae bacterium]
LRLPWHIALLHNLRDYGPAYIIEHTHRVCGWLVGLFSIGLAIGFWRTEPHGSARRWLGIAALGAVLLQGVLGIFRVSLNAWFGPQFAFVHGCVAQLVFALLVTVAVVSSRSWVTPTQTLPAADTLPLRRWSLYTAVLVFLQILLGAIVRRTFVPWGPRLHVLFAFVVAGAILWLAWTALESPARDRSLVRGVGLLGGLLVLQLMLGMESWLAKFWIPEMQHYEMYTQLKPLLVHGEGIRSLHYLVGSLLFASTVAVTVQAHRRTSWAVQPATEPIGHLEGVV